MWDSSVSSKFKHDQSLDFDEGFFQNVKIRPKCAKYYQEIRWLRSRAHKILGTIKKYFKFKKDLSVSWVEIEFLEPIRHVLFSCKNIYVLIIFINTSENRLNHICWNFFEISNTDSGGWIGRSHPLESVLVLQKLNSSF